MKIFFLKIGRLILGIILYLINPIFKVKRNRWIFGSSNGTDFKEGSKYMLMFVSNIHKIDSTWITFNPKTKNEIEHRGYQCFLNYSIKGLLYTLTAEVIFTSTSFGSDINYCFKKKGRKYVYLVHGMPHKKAIYDQPQRRMPKGNLTDRLYREYVAAFKVSDIDYLTSTSQFHTKSLKSAFRSNNIFDIGMPRNDALLNPKILGNQEWFLKYKDKFIITYMPTHRDFGKGEVSPFLFEKNNKANEFFEKNNIILLIKNHPNMREKVVLGKDKNNIIDISKNELDPQSVIYNTDLLITDFSSVWIDYLLLKRPIIFYLYDDYESKDNETYFNISNLEIGSICYTEAELFSKISEIFLKYSQYRPNDRIVKKHHKYIDANSCDRLYNLLVYNRI